MEQDCIIIRIKVDIRSQANSLQWWMEMDKSTKNNILITVLLVLIGIVISSTVYKPKIEQTTMVISQPQLVKNKVISFSDGETYRYSYKTDNDEKNITFVAVQLGDCIVLRIVEIPGQAVCIDQFGLENNSDIYGSSSVFIFKSWMLAVYDKWNWKSTMTMIANGQEQEVSEYHYKVVGFEKVKNRNAFIIEEKTNDFVQKEWIDSEKRILLKAEGEGFKIELNETNAFELK